MRESSVSLFGKPSRAFFFWDLDRNMSLFSEQSVNWHRSHPAATRDARWPRLQPSGRRGTRMGTAQGGWIIFSRPAIDCPDLSANSKPRRPKGSLPVSTATVVETARTKAHDKNQLLRFFHQVPTHPVHIMPEGTELTRSIWARVWITSAVDPFRNPCPQRTTIVLVWDAGRRRRRAETKGVPVRDD